MVSSLTLSTCLGGAVDVGVGVDGCGSVVRRIMLSAEGAFGTESGVARPALVSMGGAAVPEGDGAVTGAGAADSAFA